MFICIEEYIWSLSETKCYYGARLTTKLGYGACQHTRVFCLHIGLVTASGENNLLAEDSRVLLREKGG